MSYNPQYPAFVEGRCKEGAHIKNSLTADQAHILHMALGVAGEAGEIVDAIKKYTIYQKPLDLRNLKEEIGDMLFFLQGICNATGLTFEQCISDNVEKLTKRYHSGRYSDQQAQERADK